jgi:hypothetical protein
MHNVSVEKYKGYYILQDNGEWGAYANPLCRCWDKITVSMNPFSSYREVCDWVDKYISITEEDHG